MKAASAARSSASFLLRPSPEPLATLATTAVAVNRLAWSGPDEAILYSTQVLFPLVLFLALTFARVPRPTARVLMVVFLLLLAANNLRVIQRGAG